MQDDVKPPSAPAPTENTETTANDSTAATNGAPAATLPEPVTPPPPVDNPGRMVVGNGKPSHRKWWWALTIVVLLAAVAAGSWYLGHMSNKPAATTGTSQSTKPSGTNAASHLTLDPNKNYGDKYASGVVPVGDGKYTTSGAKQGYVYACSQYAQNLASDNGGAGTRGPWFTNNNTEYDLNKKVHVAGSVTWQGSFTNNVAGSTRTITTNDLPGSHSTGVFPIASSDPAYAYDRNPNKITAQSFTYALAASPTYGSPNCMGGQVGVMLTGVALFSAFDAGGRDAGAWEVQDSCSGHPEKDGVYHYHTLSSCIKDTSVSTVIGFALDGFPITGPKVGPNNILTSSDLDVCHGITSQITLDGKTVTTYHYVMTQDFPYSVACYRATAIQPPGQQSAPTSTNGQSVRPVGPHQPAP